MADDKKKKKSKRVSKGAKSVNDIIKMIQLSHGKTSVRRMNDSYVAKDVDVISTGSFHVDEALGIGGLPKGRVTEIYGPEGGGKTTLALHCIAAAQRAGGHALFIDAEHALDMTMAKRIGVKPKLLIVNQPDCGEQGFDVLEMGIESGQFAIAVVDSVAAMVPKAEIEGTMDDHHMGLQARLMGQGLRKISGPIAKTNTLMIFINQLRMKIGVSWGNPEITPGGHALKFFASVRMDIRRIGAVKYKENVIGNQVRVKIVKNKLAPPFKTIETELIFGKGFNNEGELLEMGRELDIIMLKGGNHYYRKKLIGKSRLKACANLYQHRDLYDSLLTDVQIERGSQT